MLKSIQENYRPIKIQSNNPGKKSGIFLKFLIYSGPIEGSRKGEDKRKQIKQTEETPLQSAIVFEVISKKSLNKKTNINGSSQTLCLVAQKDELDRRILFNLDQKQI